ncbi:hypothetical protein E3N88_08389 [Mikania micrantha]|uniref:Apple domain-containing protein n=1 Tax=Mikania micrantha TaxID=192012 RepID=A0A5N6PIB6_9ASTR|nr:hypothetical protein E3N88_08389 [Mikania micrantha]
MNVNNLLLFRYDLDYVYTDEERYFSYNSINYVNPMWILRPHGRIVDSNDRVISTSDLCYGYDSGNGYVASSKTPHCRSESDKFSPMNGDFASDTTRRSVDDNSSLSIGDCMINCWNDCGCLGFITGGNGTGCIRWSGTKSVSNFSVDSLGNSVSKFVLVSSNSDKGPPPSLLSLPLPLSLVRFDHHSINPPPFSSAFSVSGVISGHDSGGREAVFKEICGLLEQHISLSSDESQIWQQLQHYSQFPDFNNYLAFILARAEILAFAEKLLLRDADADYGGVDDMTKLAYLNEPRVLDNLKKRYNHYTSKLK